VRADQGLSPSGRLLAVNVGVPREVPWEGKTIRTAIWKRPVSGPVMVRRINLDGDDQADRRAHGGEHRAVFVYQIDSYRYWERELGRDGFTFGQFGENFTVDGLADDQVCIGDRYRIGQAIFEVTQPRVTCFRVGIRMNEPRMPSLLVAHHRPGFYLRVLQEGTVQTGDEIVRLGVGPEQLTVAEVDGLLYLPHRSRRRLEQAVRVPALSEGWRGSFQQLLEQADAQHRPPPPAWSGFRSLRVTEVRRESSTIVSFRLLPVDGPAVPPASPGQYLTLRLTPGGARQPAVIRSYSLSALSSAEAGYRISVKREPHGTGSGFLHGHVRVGDTLEAAAPRGSFVLTGGERPVALISAGVGVTPVLAMLEQLAATGSRRQVWWLHGARNAAEQAFAAEVDRRLGGLEHAHRLVAYSRPMPDRAPDEHFDLTGRLTAELLDTASVPVDADYYLCGPKSFMEAFSAALTARGVRPERVSTEVFGTVATLAPGVSEGDRRAPHAPDGSAGRGPAVTFTHSNLTVPWDPSYQSLLELAEACDVPVSFGCRIGVCHYCESGLLTGQVRYTTDPLEPPDDTRVLVCCSEPTSDLALEL
jgi:ferredoxin-NADP reductase/MOSC domain-containing protein YiiM